MPDSGAPLPTTDKAAQEAVGAIETAAKASEQIVEKTAITAYPWLGIPVLRQIWEGFFDWLVSQLGNFLAIFGGYVIVDAQEYADLRAAASALSKLNAAKISGDQNAIDQASAGVDQAVAPILHYVGDSKSH